MHVTKFGGGEDDRILPGDWEVLDALLCDALARVRVWNPSRTLEVKLVCCILRGAGELARMELEHFLPNFRGLGGVVSLVL